jgi:hypothetical protein
VASAVPGLSSVLQVSEEDAPDLSGAAGDAETAGADLTSPLVAHVKDLQTGEISLYQGERQVIYKDPALAARLYRASH